MFSNGMIYISENKIMCLYLMTQLLWRFKHQQPATTESEISLFHLNVPECITMEVQLQQWGFISYRTYI